MWDATPCHWPNINLQFIFLVLPVTSFEWLLALRVDFCIYNASFKVWCTVVTDKQTNKKQTVILDFFQDIESKRLFSCIFFYNFVYSCWIFYDFDNFWQFSWISVGQLWLVGPVKVEFVDQAEEDLIVALKKPGGIRLLEFTQQILREKAWTNCYNQW